ncbi:GatB/YqeY domain-containing protein [Phytoactinopolyspora alkaliphila]|uniref:GatB/YqeY domain-containing protein n=1 Tax=Phytoactinopolyspora alkaliphila TaxID=1783498 RepID=A0A6N9YLV8_9ACTN|nr:GatB/YqeY domain-containing protein [Phytoactinopolyspora alkaliphila]NED95838.1 GatB/YqeY domain-containing protein [Phytoactinopolyspora alkaliphila]
MASLKDRIKSDLTDAMRARDDVRKGTLRMVLSAIGTAEVAGQSAKELSDDEITAVLTRELKRRREAAEAFRSGGRADSADQEEAEAAIIAEYLPTPLSDAELADLVDQAVAEAGAESPRDMGKVMKVLQPKVAGRAEGRVVADAVKARLS